MRKFQIFLSISTTSTVIFASGSHYIGRQEAGNVSSLCKK
ncbi:hypothetical protein MY7_3274 [Bacillus sp. CN2]|nr:hypothetical protein BCBMB205_34660 [Bacillus velezensis]ARZ59812.1 hypothetical protein BAGQ_3608 [Bacillus velezensis]EIF14910.1 hypothetical protein MY7_3274 [Bacillus sp. 5B6]GFR54881.1 hypothetical protein MY7_3274 [Bacillus sp. CN2]